MHLSNRTPLLALLLVVLLGCSFVFAQNAPATVNFSLRTTDGQTITSDSLRGRARRTGLWRILAAAVEGTVAGREKTCR